MEFIRLLQAYQNLKVLSIFMVYMNQGIELPSEKEKLEYGEKLSKALIDFAPKKLRAIWFSEFDFKFSLKTLETLLENWRSHTSLSIFTSDLDYGREEYMEIINKYKNDEVIKDFKYNYDNCFFDREMM